MPSKQILFRPLKPSLGMGVVLALMACSGMAHADIEARLTGKMARAIDGPSSEQLLHLEASRDVVLISSDSTGDAVRYGKGMHMLTVRSGMQSGAATKTLDMMAVARSGKSLDQLGVRASTGVRLCMLPANARASRQFVATGRQQTVAGPSPIAAEVYRLTWTAKPGQDFTSDVLLSRDPAALAFTDALQTMATALEGGMAGENGQAVMGFLGDLQSRGLGVLAVQDCFALTWLDGHAQLDTARLAEPTQFDKPGGGATTALAERGSGTVEEMCHAIDSKGTINCETSESYARCKKLEGKGKLLVEGHPKPVAVVHCNRAG